jgi:NAD(P)-dependent dehydrogenase (short-subunit alcohol dehydrogenase family)/catechol 2,3-dioxygenase-like lactoylglutathione lyase family enzyme
MRDCPAHRSSANAADIRLAMPARAAYRRAIHRSLAMNTTTSPLAGLRIVLTGGTSGLGLALLKALRQRGAQVGFVARQAERVRAVAAAHPGTHGVAGDVADKQQTHPLALQLAGLLGGVDVLIHNASSLGPVPLKPLADTECEQFDEALATNVLGPFRLTRALLGSLAASARDGRAARVLFIGSDAGLNAYAGWGAYGASKAAARHLAAIWNQELAPLGIRVIELDPGDMDTPLHAAAVPEADPATLQRPADAAERVIARLEASIADAAAAATPAEPILDDVDHLHVHVRDRAAAEAWYRDVLGLRRIDALAHWARDGGPLTIANAGGSIHLALFEQPPQPGNRSTIALSTSAEGFVAWRRRLGAALGESPRAVDHGQSWSLYFRDPDGNPYEITTYEHAAATAALDHETETAR